MRASERAAALQCLRGFHLFFAVSAVRACLTYEVVDFHLHLRVVALRLDELLPKPRVQRRMSEIQLANDKDREKSEQGTHVSSSSRDSN